MRRTHIVFYCRECGHRSPVSRGEATDRICPQCFHYGYKPLPFSVEDLKIVNRILRDAKAKPIEAGEVT